MKLKKEILIILIIFSTNTLIGSTKNENPKKITIMNDTMDSYKSELINEGITVVKFYATWCTPCKMYDISFKKTVKNLKEIKKENQTIPIKYMDIDCDKYPLICQNCNVNSLPTTLFYKNGKLSNSIIGILSQDGLSRKINESVN